MMSLRMLGLFFLQLVFTLVTSSLKTEHTWNKKDIGPRENETRRFLYTDPTQTSAYHVCKFCEKKALDDGSYQHYQESQCFLRYYAGGTFSDTLMTSEEETVKEKRAFCNRGETPGCGPPPVHYNWSCSFGYTVTEYHSVYSYCRRYCTWSPDLKWELYCNESLLWEIVEDPGNKCFEPPIQKTDTPVNTTIIAVGVSVASVVVIIIVIIVCVLRMKKRRRKRRNKKNAEAIPLQAIASGPPVERTENQAYNMEPTDATETELSEDAVAEPLLVRQEGESDDGSYARAMDITDSKTILKSSQTETSSDFKLDRSTSERCISAGTENTDIKERYTASVASGDVELHISDSGSEKDVEMVFLDVSGDESLTGAIGGLQQIGDTTLKEFKHPGRNMHDLPVTHAGHSKFISDGENLYNGLRDQVEHEALGNYLTNVNADLAHPVPPLMENNQVNSAVESNRSTQDTLFASIANADASREVINKKGADVILIVDQGKIGMTNSDKKYAIQVPEGDTIYVYPVSKEYVSFEIRANSTVRSKNMWVQEKSMWCLVGVTLEDTGMYTWKLSYPPECGLPDKVGHFKLLCQSEKRADPSGRVTTFVTSSQPQPQPPAPMRNIQDNVAQVNGFQPGMTDNQNPVPTTHTSALSAYTNNPCTVISNDINLSLVRPETSGCEISIEQIPATNSGYIPLNIESFSNHSSAGRVNYVHSPMPLNQDTQLSHSLPRLDVQSLLNDSNSHYHSHINRNEMQLMNQQTGLDEPGIPLVERLPPIGCEHNEEVVESRHSQSSGDSDSEMENLHYTEVKQLHTSES